MYYWRVFLWENGHKSTEYTGYVVAPIFLEDKLDERSTAAKSYSRICRESRAERSRRKPSFG